MKENQTNDIKSVVFHDSQPVSLAEIQARIFMIRDVQVMLDRDLAILYHVATKALNQAVKRHMRRFPERFMFQLTKEEFENWKSQIVTSDIYSQEEIEALKMGARRCPYVFTEQGVAQLSAVLHSDEAEDASVRIMDAFVAMRRFITANAGLFQRVGVLEQKQIETDKKLDVVLDKIEELSPAVTTEELFGTGCVWDAYSFLSSLVRHARQRIILIDNFVDERTLLLLDKRASGVECTVHT
ncbi:MAG: ORF6N domain-containing protein, partial [Bacteroidales bacterium]|nr:ORF6N domain-containing protein [Bacteroidales bacterium]